MDNKAFGLQGIQQDVFLWEQGALQNKIKTKKKLDRANPTQPPPIQTFLLETHQLTWTAYSNHND